MVSGLVVIPNTTQSVSIGLIGLCLTRQLTPANKRRQPPRRVHRLVVSGCVGDLGLQDDVLFCFGLRSFDLVRVLPGVTSSLAYRLPTTGLNLLKDNNRMKNEIYKLDAYGRSNVGYSAL